MKIDYPLVFTYTHLIFLLLTLGASIYTFVIFSDEHDTPRELSLNWRRPFFADIKVGHTCPDGYEETGNYEWSGTSRGCWCGFVSKETFDSYDLKYRSIISVYCEEAYEDDLGCFNIFETPSFDLNYIGKVEGSPTKICAKYSHSTLANSPIPSGQSPEGYIRCGDPDSHTAVCT